MPALQGTKHQVPRETHFVGGADVGRVVTGGAGALEREKLISNQNPHRAESLLEQAVRKQADVAKNAKLEP